MTNSRPTSDIRVQARIAWSSIFAGVLVTLVVLITLSAVGTAIGLTLRRGDPLTGTGNFVWTILVGIVALYLGGMTASRLVAWETRKEAAAYGVILWGIIYVSLLIFGGLGIMTTFHMLMGLGSDPTVSSLDMNMLARELGLAPEQVARLKDTLREMYATRHAVASAWWNLAGILCSLGAAVTGSIVGSERDRRRPLHYQDNVEKVVSERRHSR